MEVVEISELRTSFHVTKSHKKEPNTAEVTITNLSEARRRTLQQKGVRFILQAGYEGSGVGVIFSGDARTVEHKKDGSSWHTTIKTGDGERAFQFARSNESFAEGTRLSDVVRRLAGNMGIGLGNLNKIADSIPGQFSSGYAAFGPSSKELDKVLTQAGFEWSIQDNELLILKPDQNNGSSVPDIGPDSGLIGSPEYGSPESIHQQIKKTGKPLLKIKCLLNTDVKVSSQVNVRSDRHRGPVIVRKLEHIGDTHGGDWYTIFDGVPL